MTRLVFGFASTNYICAIWTWGARFMRRTWWRTSSYLYTHPTRCQLPLPVLRIPGHPQYPRSTRFCSYSRMRDSSRARNNTASESRLSQLCGLPQLQLSDFPPPIHPQLSEGTECGCPHYRVWQASSLRLTFQLTATPKIDQLTNLFNRYAILLLLLFRLLVDTYQLEQYQLFFLHFSASYTIHPSIETLPGEQSSPSIDLSQNDIDHFQTNPPQVKQQKSIVPF